MQRNIELLRELLLRHWLLVAVVLLVFFILLDLAIRLLNLRRNLQRNLVFLEVTPPAFSDKSPLATKHLFAVLHSITSWRSWRDRLLNRSQIVSLEVLSTREHGIRYLIQVHQADIAVLQQSLAAYLPNARFQVVKEPPYSVSDQAAPYVRVLEYSQNRHFAHPLNAQDSLGQHDPIAYIAGAMTKLEPGETVALQVVLTPYFGREARKVHKKLLRGSSPLLEHKFRRYFLATTLLIVLVAVGLALLAAFLFLAFIVGLIAAVAGMDLPSPRPSQKSAANDERTAAQQRIHDRMLEKLGHDLFRADIRGYVAASSQYSRYKKIAALYASLAPLRMPGYQSLGVGRTFPRRLWQRYSLFKFRHRLPSILMWRSSVLAASEMGDLYHFPYADSSQTENLVKSHSRTLPAPLLLKQYADANEFVIPIGVNHHHGTATEIGLTAKDRERHAYIIGGTGNGKTTLMLGAMIQDAHKGKGFAFIDPHGDAAETLISHIPEERVKDVIYFSPDDLGHPIGLNLLELREGLTDDELLREKDLVTEATISVFRKIFSEEDEGGHRIEYVLRNAVQTALTQQGATLFTVFDLLNDPRYRKQVVSKLQDKDLKNFWQNELGKAGNFQRVKMAAGITAKIGRFLFSASAKRILEQPKSTIDFDDIMNSGKVLVCNFSKGLLGEDTSELFGITVLAKLQMAALRRARILQEDRRPFYLYVDEFQNFATASFVQMLSEARKYRLYMTLAEQSTSQQKDQLMVQVILANVGTLVCFRTGNPADEKLLLPFFAPYIDAGEIANLPAYNFYMRIAGIKTQEPFSGETILPPEEGSDSVARRVVDYSREHYSRKPAPPSTSQPSSQPKDKPAEKDPDRKPEDRRPQKKHKVAK